MKAYHEQRYPVAIDVLVAIHNPDGTVCESWVDGIKGLNVGHALYLARLNWPACTVTLHDAPSHLIREA